MQPINWDASVNLVVFEVRQGDRLRTVIGQGPTRSVHTIEHAWKTCAEGHNLQPGDVRRVYSEWQPSAEDAAFLETTLSGVPVTYSFARPASDDDQAWTLALRDAAATMERSRKRRWWQFWS